MALASDPSQDESHGRLRPATPACGDVVVTLVSGEGTVTMAQWPGLPQTRHLSLADALELAERFARRSDVDVWICQDGIHERIWQGRRTSTTRSV